MILGSKTISLLLHRVANDEKEQVVMTKELEWSKDVYEKSISSRCWWYTPYDEGWGNCPQLSADDELRRIVEMELELGPVPEWAQQIVERSIHSACPCGHYLFPQPYLEAVSAIGFQTPPAFVHGCFTVERERKKQMMDYVFCLDAWLAGVGPEVAARELTALGYRRIDWHTVCADLWNVLGQHTEVKELLVERLLHSQRWKIKERPWDDDLATDFGRDQYLGALSETENPAKTYCYIDLPVPGFDEGASPRIQRLEARLAELCPDWEWFRYTIRYGWLCSPKAFRFLECLLWSIGKERRAIHTHDHPKENGGEVPGFLQCEDTYPNQDEAAEWWRSFLAALHGWWHEQPEEGNVADQVNQRLGEASPVKHWLVRLFVRKLEVLERVGGRLRLLVNPPPGSKRGTRPVA